MGLGAMPLDVHTKTARAGQPAAVRWIRGARFATGVSCRVAGVEWWSELGSPALPVLSRNGTMMCHMHIVSHALLVSFYSQPEYADARDAIEAWYAIVRQAEWGSPAEVKAQFRNASIVGNNRVVFNIKGNDYRLIVAFAYRMKWAYIKFVGTHKQYDAVDAATVDQSH